MHFFVQKGLDNTQTLQYRDSIKKQELLTFADKPKTERKFSIPEDEGQSFGDILCNYDQRFLDYELLCSFPITSRPWSICNEDEKKRSVSKHTFRNSLQKLCPVKAVGPNAKPEIHTYVVDAMKIVRMIPVTNLQPRTFLTWTKKFLDYITNLDGTEIHIVFDQYSEDIDLTRPSKGRSAEAEKKYVSSITQVIPSNGTEWAIG